MLSQHARPLLSLPQLPLLNVINQLDKGDRLSLAATCRRLAMLITEAAKCRGLTVTRRTGWEGLRKVLTTKVINCSSMTVKGHINTMSLPHDGCSAFDMLLTTGATPACLFHGISRLFLDARPLPCLLPASLVSVLPDLQAASFWFRDMQFIGSHPVSYCSTLRKLCFTIFANSTPLPSQFHNPDDLRRQLPNVTSLNISEYGVFTSTDTWKHGNCIDTILEAWDDKLTELELFTNSTTIKLQQYTKLQSLKWHQSEPPARLPKLATLTKLQLLCTIQEPELAAILQLPSLIELAIEKFGGTLKQDWSKHPCSWKQLAIDTLHMVDLSKLPLHLLEGQGCLKIKFLHLPNPVLSSSLADVTHAAHCVTSAEITIEGFISWRFFHSYLFQSADPNVGSSSVDLLRIASEVVRPVICYIHHDRLGAWDRAENATAVISWASQSIRHITYISKTHDTWFWQALQGCCNLEEILYDVPIRATETIEVLLLTTILWAAQHVMAVTHKPFNLVLKGGKNKSKEMGEAVQAIRKTLQDQLPKSVHLQAYNWEPAKSRLVVDLAPCK